MSAGKTDDYRWLTANELTKISKDSLFRRLSEYHSSAEERAQRRAKDEAMGYSQIVKAFLDADQRMQMLKDKPEDLENAKRAVLNREYDEAVKRGIVKLHDGCKEVWVSKKFVEWMYSDEEYLKVKEEFSSAISDYNRYLALKTNWEEENADIIEMERIRTKRAELMAADPETLRALEIEPEETATKETSQQDDGKDDLRSALKSIHPFASDAEIESMVKSYGE